MPEKDSVFIRQYDINILTPFSRRQNKDKLIAHLEPFGIQWYPIVYEDVDFGRNWIHPVKVDFPWAGIDHPYYKINRFLDTQEIVSDSYYMFLCDDDFYEKDFFKKLRPQLGPEVIVVSMKRGNQKVGITKENPIPHPISTLWGCLSNMASNLIGLEQIIIKGSIFRMCRFMNCSHADGIMAETLARHCENEILYLPDIYVLFNYLEKRRW